MKSKEFTLEASKRKKSAQSGDCFVAAGRNMIESDIPGMKLVHAYVTGRGAVAGKRFTHAWNEVGDVVIDKSNGRNIVLRKEFYYDLGNVVTQPGQYAVYDRKQMDEKLLDAETWGPWDLK
jgi:hypothetical protein